MYQKIFLFLAFCAMCQQQMTAQKMTLDEAISQQKVKATFSTLPNHELSIAVENISGGVLRIKVSPGYIAEATDPNIQDQLIIDEALILVSAGKRAVRNVTAYCCEMKHGTGGADAQFKWYGKASPTLYQAAEAIYKAGMQRSPIAQEAVWAVSDQANLAYLYDPKQKIASENLIKTIAQITGREVPWYKAKPQKVAPGPAIIHLLTLNIEADWAFSLDKDTKLTLAIYDAQGKRVGTLYEDKAHKAGQYTSHFTYETNKLPSGIYYVRMSSAENNRMQERKVII